jgi:competence protein ComEC
LGLALAFTCWRGRPARFLPLAFFGVLGLAFYQQAWQPAFPAAHVAHLPRDREVSLLGRLTRPGKIGPERVQLVVGLEAWATPQGWHPARGRILVSAPPLEPPPVGTRLVLRGSLRAPERLKNPGTFDRPRHLAAEGIFRQLRLRQPGNLVFLASPETLPLGERLRGGIRRLLKKLPPESRAVYLAMLLGDQGEVTPQLRRALSHTGTSHLLAINGLHLGMVAAVTYGLAFFLLRRFSWLLLRVNVLKIATLLAAGPVVAYAWMAGGSPSTQRAEVMVLAYLLLVFLGRPREVWSALALAALVILSLAPLRLFSISFQLSFVAVAGLAYVLPRWFGGRREAAGAEGASRGWGAWLWWRGKEALAVSTVATLATAPLVAAYFQVVSLLGILVNLVAIPLVLGVALPLGEVAVLAQALSLTSLSQALLEVGRLPLELGLGAVKGAAQLPGSAILTPTPTWLQIACYYLFVALLVSRGPGGRRMGKNHKFLMIPWAGIILSALIFTGSIVWPWARGGLPALEVTCLDTYGGLAGVAVTPEGHRLVFSAGRIAWRGSGVSAPGPLPAYLHWRQFRRLDLVMALNLGQANAPELLALAQQFRVGQWWYGTREAGGPDYVELYNLLGDQGRIPRSLEKGDPPAALGDMALAYPRLGPDLGVALRLRYQGRDLLILPPLRQAAAGLNLAGVPPVEGLIVPADLVGSEQLARLAARLEARHLVAYGPGRRTRGRGEPPPDLPCLFTRDGAVSLYLSETALEAKQWRP